MALEWLRNRIWCERGYAVISMIVPVVVFLSMQRYFIRGLLAGSVKGG